MVNLNTLKAGSVIEARFNDGPNRCGIVIDIQRRKSKKPLANETFSLRAMFYMEEFKCNWEITIESSQIVFIAPVQPDFTAIIDNAKNQSMRWTCTTDSESEPLDFVTITTPDDGFNLNAEEIAKLKAMQVGDSFTAGSDGEALIKRVA